MQSPAAILAGAVLVLLILIGWYWSWEPAPFNVSAYVVRPIETQVGEEAITPPKVIGSVTTNTLVQVVRTLLEKPGGYLSNDVTPPSLWLDNMPNWEFGALVQARDLSRAFRNDWSRSQSQSVEDPSLSEADPKLSFDNNSWILPASESEYKEAISHIEDYLARLSDPNQQDAQFFARADNLSAWLVIVEKRLGSYSQRLSASVGQVRVNTDLAGDPDARQSTPKPQNVEVKTPWLEIDDVFYETRGASWALLHFLQAVEIDFNEILVKKNALVSLRQIIRELEASQADVWSPMIMNGSGFGMTANHSLVMASYISRAHAAVIDLRELLADG